MPPPYPAPCQQPLPNKKSSSAVHTVVGNVEHIFYMQKHNEWVSNKGYLRHLEVLSKISHRKAQSLNPCPSVHNRTAPLRPRPTLNDSPSHDEATLRTSPRDQLILWDNYQLGRRII